MSVVLLTVKAYFSLEENKHTTILHSKRFADDI